MNYNTYFETVYGMNILIKSKASLWNIALKSEKILQYQPYLQHGIYLVFSGRSSRNFSQKLNFSKAYNNLKFTQWSFGFFIYFFFY